MSRQYELLVTIEGPEVKIEGPDDYEEKHSLDKLPEGLRSLLMGLLTNDRDDCENLKERLVRARQL